MSKIELDIVSEPQMDPQATMPPGYAPTPMQPGYAPNTVQAGYAPTPMQPGYAPNTVQAGYAPTTMQPGHNMAMGQPGFPSQFQYGTNSTTTVVLAQPAAPTVTRPPEREFSTGLFGCFDDMSICLCVFICPTCYLHKLSTEMGEGCCMANCVPSPLIPMRAAWRNRHNIRGSIHNDCCVACWCYQCALCQLGQDVKMVKRSGGY